MSRKMKDSGIGWIGEIPEDWETIKMRNLGMFSSSGINKLINPDEPLVKIINYTDVYGNKSLLLNNKDYMTVSANEEKINKHSVKEGDLIFTPSSETIEDIGVSALVNEPLKNTAFSYHVLRFQFNRNVIKNFKKYLCNNYYVRNVFSRKATGSIRKTLNRDDFKELIVLLPPLNVQQKIANFLDQKVSEIDHILEKTRESIEEYKKYKQSIITEAVTKGLNPYAEMKDSGIEWIGEMPKHWEVKKIKYIAKLNQKVLSENTDEDYFFRYVDISSVTLESGIENYEEINYANAPSRARRVVTKGDVIISTVRTYLKAIALVEEDDRVVVSTGFAVLTPYNINSAYLEYYCKCTPFVNAITAYSTGVSYPAINASSIMEFKAAIPTIDEQQSIAYFLRKKCSEINNLISQKETLLKDLELYKKSLIYECVTGKREVV